MKILLIGEYSSLHKNLKDGLIELGHQVTIAADTCGWMDIKPDIPFSSIFNGYLGKIDSYIIKPLQALPQLHGYDVVQFMNPLILQPKTLPLIKYFFKNLIKNNGKSFLLAAGDDSYFATITNDNLRYSPWPDAIQYDGFSPATWKSQCIIDWNRELISLVDGVIPIMYEYEYGYKFSNISNLVPIIPIPVNLKTIKYKENTIKDKILFFHGLNRYGFKGTKYIEEAFKIVQNKYPNDVNCRINGKMPLNQYLELLTQVNVALDQTSSYSYGVNAVYSLAMGHVVMSGSEPESMAGFGVTKSPVINIKPSASQIVSQLELVLEHRNKINELGYASRKYAEELHDHIKVAKKYIYAWTKGNA
jgi:hypothetical protein